MSWPFLYIWNDHGSLLSGSRPTDTLSKGYLLAGRASMEGPKDQFGRVIAGERIESCPVDTTGRAGKRLKGVP